MSDSLGPNDETTEEEAAARTSDYLKNQMRYLKARYLHERHKLEQRSFARRRDD